MSWDKTHAIAAVVGAIGTVGAAIAAFIAIPAGDLNPLILCRLGYESECPSAPSSSGKA